MHTCVLILALVLPGTLPAADDGDARPLTPAEAAKHVKEKCTVQMEVKSAGHSEKAMLIFLNSETDHRSAKNFTVVIDESALAKFKEVNIDNPQAYYKGKLIRVTGTITTYQDHPEIKVEGPDQIRVVEKDK